MRSKQLETIREQEMPMVDTEIIGQLEQVGGWDLVTSIYEDFEIEATTLVQESLDAFAIGDIPTVKSHLHTLKGSAGTIGVARMAQIAREAEGKLKVSDSSTLGDDLRLLDKEFKLFLSEYKNTLEKLVAEKAG